MPHLERDGVKISYRLHGTSGDPLLLLMGLGIDSNGWALQVPAFAANHRLLLVDNRGVGRSGKPPGPYSTATMADDAIAALDAAGIERAHVVGLSMGGMIAQEVAIRHPHRVGALALCSTYARPGREVTETSEKGNSQFGGISLVELAKGGQVDLSKFDVRGLLDFLLPLVFSARFLKENSSFLDMFLAQALANGFSAEGFFGQVGAVLSHDTVARLGTVKSPTLVMTGTVDDLVPPHHSDELQRLIPGAKLTRVEGGTHGFNFEMSVRFNEILLEFLAAHPLS
jgi:pimeloyl-ACP methyl ester carboxylesterase